jgi:hypothetical protein
MKPLVAIGMTTVAAGNDRFVSQGCGNSEDGNFWGLGLEPLDGAFHLDKSPPGREVYRDEMSTQLPALATAGETGNRSDCSAALA